MNYFLDDEPMEGQQDLPKTMDEYVAEYLSDVDLESLEEIVEGLLDEVDNSASSSDVEGGKMTETPIIDAQKLAQAAGNAEKHPVHIAPEVPVEEDEEEIIDYSGPSV